jgi:F-type H+-transporting ATPase subunit delta
MRPLIIAERYSRSAYQLAEEKGLGNSFLKELQAVKDAMEARSELMSLLRSPLITRDEKRSLIEGILGPKASSLAREFLNLLVAKGRIDLFPDIVGELKRLTNEREKIQEVTAISARELHPSILQLLQKALEKMTGKKIILRTEEDSSLLGGIQIQLGNRLIDGTLRSKLNALESQLRMVRI